MEEYNIGFVIISFGALCLMPLFLNDRFLVPFVLNIVFFKLTHAENAGLRSPYESLSKILINLT